MKQRGQILKLIQGYLGMSPKDKGCDSWNAMQEKLADEIMKTNELFMAKEVRKKLLSINPQIIENSKYTNPFLYDDTKKWYEELGSVLKDSDKFVELHDTLKCFFDNGDFSGANDFMKLFCNKKSSVGDLKTILVITKSLKDRKEISSTRKKIVSLLEKKLGSKLV